MNRPQYFPKLINALIDNLKTYSNVTLKLSEGLEDIEDSYIKTDKKNRLYYDKLILTIPQEHLIKLEYYFNGILAEVKTYQD